MTTGRRPATLDRVVAAACATLTCGVLLGLPALAATDGGRVGVVPTRGSLPWWLCGITLVVQAVVLGWVRVRDRAVPIAVAVLPLGLCFGAGAAVGDAFTLTWAAVTVAVFRTALLPRLVGADARRGPGRGAVLVLVSAAVVVGQAGVGLQTGTPWWAAAGSGLAQAVGAVGLPLLVGVAIRNRRDVTSARLEAAESALREKEALLRAAVAEERTAMARELHDIAAHHLSGIVVMSAAIGRQIDTAPETAKRSVEQVRTQSRAVLDDLRRLVGLLRREADPTRPESLAGVADLVRQRRGSGTTVELRVTDDPDGHPLGEGVGPVAQLALYRTAQEALANAVSHAAGAPVLVEIADDRDVLRLSVSNDAAPAPTTTASAPTRTGFGIVGMQERAALVGAQLKVGPRADGGWEVTMTVAKNGDEAALASGWEETT